MGGGRDFIWCSESEATLVDAIMDRQNCLFDNITYTEPQRQQFWAEILSLVNAYAADALLPKQTIKQLKKKWTNLKQEVKKLYFKNLKENNKTGNGPLVELDLTSAESKTLEWLKVNRPELLVPPATQKAQEKVTSAVVESAEILEDEEAYVSGDDNLPSDSQPATTTASASAAASKPTDTPIIKRPAARETQFHTYATSSPNESLQQEEMKLRVQSLKLEIEFHPILKRKTLAEAEYYEEVVKKLKGGN